MINIIAALTKNNVLGKNNQLLSHVTKSYSRGFTEF